MPVLAYVVNTVLAWTRDEFQLTVKIELHRVVVTEFGLSQGPPVTFLLLRKMCQITVSITWSLTNP